MLTQFSIETFICRKNVRGILSVANKDIITEPGMPGKETKQFAHLSVLIDLIHTALSIIQERKMYSAFWEDN